MFYKILHTNEFDQVIYARIDDDGKCRLTCNSEYPGLQEWINQGNEPLPADAPTEE